MARSSFSSLKRSCLARISARRWFTSPPGDFSAEMPLSRVRVRAAYPCLAGDLSGDLAFSVALRAGDMAARLLAAARAALDRGTSGRGALMVTPGPRGDLTAGTDDFVAGEPRWKPVPRTLAREVASPNGEETANEPNDVVVGAEELIFEDETTLVDWRRLDDAGGRTVACMRALDAAVGALSLLVEAARRLARRLSELLVFLSESAALGLRTGIELLTGSPVGRPFPMMLAARERGEPPFERERGELLLERARRLLEDALRVTVLLRELSLAIRSKLRLLRLREREPVLEAEDLADPMLWSLIGSSVDGGRSPKSGIGFRVMEALDDSFLAGELFIGDPFRSDPPRVVAEFLMLSIALFLLPASTYSPSLVQRSGELYAVSEVVAAIDARFCRRRANLRALSGFRLVRLRTGVAAGLAGAPRTESRSLLSTLGAVLVRLLEASAGASFAVAILRLPASPDSAGSAVSASLAVVPEMERILANSFW